MAETYRKAKIEHFYERLLIRRGTLKKQLELAEYSEERSMIKGQMLAIDLIINEIAAEFEIVQSDE